MSNKVIYVKAHFKPTYGKLGVLKSLFGSTQTGSQAKPPEGMEQKGWSDCEIDGERLAEDIAGAIEQLNSAGFDLHSVENIVSGRYNSDYSTTEKSSYGWGYGFSFTEGVIVIGKK